MNTTQRTGLLQRWRVVRGELIPDLGKEAGGITPKLAKLIHTLEWVRIEEFVPVWQGMGRPPKDRGALANGFVAKAVLGLPTPVARVDRLTVDRALRRLMWIPPLEKTAGRSHIFPSLCRVCRKQTGRAGS